MVYTFTIEPVLASSFPILEIEITSPSGSVSFAKTSIVITASSFVTVLNTSSLASGAKFVAVLIASVFFSIDSFPAISFTFT